MRSISRKNTRIRLEKKKRRIHLCIEEKRKKKRSYLNEGQEKRRKEGGKHHQRTSSISTKKKRIHLEKEETVHLKNGEENQLKTKKRREQGREAPSSPMNHPPESDPSDDPSTKIRPVTPKRSPSRKRIRDRVIPPAQKGDGVPLLDRDLRGVRGAIRALLYKQADTRCGSRGTDRKVEHSGARSLSTIKIKKNKEKIKKGRKLLWVMPSVLL